MQGAERIMMSARVIRGHHATVLESTGAHWASAGFLLLFVKVSPSTRRLRENVCAVLYVTEM